MSPGLRTSRTRLAPRNGHRRGKGFFSGGAF
jgi:hypothetical protein